MLLESTFTVYRIIVSILREASKAEAAGVFTHTQARKIPDSLPLNSKTITFIARIHQPRRHRHISRRRRALARVILLLFTWGVVGASGTLMAGVCPLLFLVITLYLYL